MDQIDDTQTAEQQTARCDLTPEEKAEIADAAASNRQLAASFVDDLADHLLNLAKATDKISADEFAGQLWTWAAAMARHLEAGTDHGSQPTVADLRASLHALSRDADKLLNSLARLPIEAFDGLGQAFGGDQALTDYQEFAAGEACVRQSIIQVDELCRAAKRAAEACDGTRTKDGPKNRRQNVRRMAVEELALAWWILTGKKPTRRVYNTRHERGGDSFGEFQEFVIAALEPVFGKTEASQGIDGVIKGVLANMAETDLQLQTRFFHVKTMT